MLRLISLLSSAALTAAVLLPPPASLEGLSINNPLERIVEIGCPGCMFPKKTGDTEFTWTRGIQNSLVLNFTTTQDDVPRLLVNDVPIYPVTRALPPPIFAFQIEASESTSAIAYSAEYPPVVENRIPLQLGVELAISNHGDGHTYVHFAINQLNGVLVTGLDAIYIALIDPEDKRALAIGDLELQPTTRAGASPLDEEKAGAEKECTMFPLLCKWKALLAAKLNATKGALRKGCMKLRPVPTPKKKPAEVEADVNVPEPPKLHVEHPHHDYHTIHRTKFGQFMHVVRKIVTHVLVPVMFGVVAGMTGSLIGMIVGHFCVVLFRLIFRRGAKYQRVEQDEEAAADKDEEMEDGCASPPPEYEELGGEEVVVSEKE